MCLCTRAARGALTRTKHPPTHTGMRGGRLPGVPYECLLNICTHDVVFVRVRDSPAFVALKDNLVTQPYERLFVPAESRSDVLMGASSSGTSCRT